MIAGLGCGGGPESPEEAVRALLKAGITGDAEAFRGLFPSREEVEEWFACPIGIELAGRFEGPFDELSTWRKNAPEIKALSQAEVEGVEVGGAVGGCTAKVGMSLVRVDVTLVEGGVERMLPMRFIGVDGRVSVLGY
jgi:hypothetical protein